MLRADARALAPFDLILRNGERELRPAIQQRFERALPFDARELVAKAEVNAVAKGQVPVGLPRDVEAIGIGKDGLIPVGRADDADDDVTRLYLVALESDVLGGHARRDLHRPARVSLEREPQTAQQHGDIRALSAVVGVELVEHEVLQTAGALLPQRLVFATQ